MKKVYTVTLLKNTRLNAQTVWLEFLCPEIAKNALPGQFINLSGGGFLMRPFGIADTDQSAGTLCLGIKEAGAGTRDISKSPVGTTFQMLGPLGEPFPRDKIKKLIVIGGGTGIFPLRFSVSFAKERSIPAISILGFREKDEILLENDWENLSQKVIITTDRGDFGIRGTVMDGIATLSSEDTKDAAVFCVGPEIMMKYVAGWTHEQRIPCYVSMEKRMACGIGACLVCACKVKAKEDGIPFHHVRCCKEGPVMNAEEILW